MSSVLQALSCFFHDPFKYVVKKNNLLIFNEKTDCDDYYYPLNTFEVLEDLEARLNISTDLDWQLVMIVRDPIERFLSGYMHICYAGLPETCERLCNGCGANL